MNAIAQGSEKHQLRIREIGTENTKDAEFRHAANPRKIIFCL